MPGTVFVMSIYSTWLHLAAETCTGHPDGVDCECVPVTYLGSGVTPDAESPRGGSFDVAAIPNHCHPDAVGSDRVDGPSVDFLRVSVSDGGPLSTVVLNAAQVRELYDVLGLWLTLDVRW